MRERVIEEPLEIAGDPLVGLGRRRLSRRNTIQ
jgi:hypothetical protein